ncbi:hypothetical protein F5B22DRAFT_598569 [Xylaria bambusicola]|uniref:uncharacterized protein n=1 Tax=Xylaria bambusicola TaxID=326684 RepID=UPI002007F8D1|nr:uncharacterized protein F5B22DRAFT_598569 [Xylaria bambusicola]KAI0520834.1 hypothetical protein F5B22DRAFT_598569 [Xylaria bambusicola]
MDDGLFRYSKDAPLSPWAERFPNADISYVSGHINHSILAPKYPRVNDPKYYDPDALPADNQVPKSYKEIDNCLACEQVQQGRLYNLQTWQAAVLRRYLRFSPEVGFISGGHRPGDASTTGQHFPTLIPPSPGPTALSSNFPQNQVRNEQKAFQIYERDRIKVDEAKWFSFFRKERWFDWLHIDPDFEELPGRNWTVDDPDIWKHLSLSIELADRMLKALIQDKHDGLQTMLYGRIDYWDQHVDCFGPPPLPDGMVLLSHAQEVLLSQTRGEPSCQWDHIATHSSQDWADRLEKLFNTIIWGFGHLDKGVDGQTNYANIDDKHFPYSSILVVHIGWFVTMLESDLALEELCTLQVNLAITIIHELMHAIYRTRHNNDNYVGTLTDKKRNGGRFGIPAEPFINGYGFRETGFCMEHKFFGGCQFRYPETTGNDKYSIPLAVVANEWPWYWSSDVNSPGANYAQEGYVGRMEHIPSVWMSKLLSKYFWRDPAFPSKSENFFHRNQIIQVQYELRQGNPCCKNGLVVKDPRSLKYKYPEDGHMLRELKEKTYQWKNYRKSWFEKTMAEWNLTPWRDVTARKIIGQFVESFRKKDFLKCQGYAKDLRKRVDDSSLGNFRRYMPITDKKSDRWVWYCIGLLMEASIPISLRSPMRTKENAGWVHELVPSKEAAAVGNSEMVFIIANEIKRKNEVGGFRNFLLNHIQGTRITKFTQLDIVRLIRDVLGLVTFNSAVVSLGFLRAIMAATNALEKDRQDIQSNYGNAQRTRWASDWFFQFPEYDPALFKYENKKWVKQ